MDTATAEQVLGALAEPLKFASYGDAEAGARHERGRYVVHLRNEWEALSYHKNIWGDEIDEPEFCPRKFQTARQAKAACEHHHATGEWQQ